MLGGMLDTSHPFTFAEALASGMTLRQARRQQRLLHGVYVGRDVVVTPLVRAEAALKQYDDRAFASHATAARVLGLPIPTLPGDHVTVVERNHRHDRAGVTCHWVRSGSIIKRGAVRISAPVQVFVELATMLPLVDLVVVGDHLVRKGLVTLEGLRTHVAASDLPGARAAQQAVAYVRERVDSPMETRLRMLLVLAGFPEPEVNVTLRDEMGEPIRRYDLYYKRSRTAVEYDGRQHIEREEHWQSDVARREAIDDDGDRLVVLTSRDIFVTPAATLARLQRILRQRGEPGIPTRLAPAWRQHFPDRNAA